jgi:phage terminase large subunit
MQVPAHQIPLRDYQLDFLRNIRKVRLAVLVWARRAGKDYMCFHHAVQRMVEEPMNVVIVFPTAEQGFKSFWTNLENDGFKTLDHIPKSLIASQTNSVNDMRITLKNGSTLFVVGATNADAMRGANAKLYIFSEFVDIPKGVLGVVRPIVIVNGGQIIIQSTVKQDGVSGGTFKRLYEAAKKNKGQYASFIDARNYLTDAQLAEARQDYIDEYGNDFLYRQEMLLDWGQSSATSYFGHRLSAMKKNKQIGNHPYNDEYPVYTAWDLGMADSTALWFFQYYDKRVHLIDAYETHDVNDEAVIKFVISKPYKYAWHFWPHDGSKRDSDAQQRVAKARQMGLLNVSLLQRKDREMGIKKTLDLLNDPGTTIDEPMCGWAIEKLGKYQRKYNQYTGDYEGPDHKTESHIADAKRYVAEAIDQFFNPVTGDFFYTQSGKELTTHSEELVRTNIYSEGEQWGDWQLDW